MWTLLWVALSAAPPPAARAQELRAAKSWEELYLAFSAADPGKYPARDRTAIGAALEAGCEALSASDAVMAYSLGDRAALFHPSAPALLCLARTAVATEQRAAAEEALKKGLQAFPKDGAFGLALGKALLTEKDPDGAARALAKVPRRSPEWAEAQALLRQAHGEACEDRAARSEARAVEQRIERAESRPLDSSRGERQPVRAESSRGPGSLTYVSGESGGMRTRGNSRFVLKYFNDNRDFGQRAEYEGRVVGALDEAYAFTQRILGQARESPCDVILYTRDEFAAHYSEATAHRVAGLYMMNAIRINDAAEINPQNQATLVHEYVHAVVDDLTHGQSGRLPNWLNEGLAEYVEWRYQGSDDPPVYLSGLMRTAARADQLPSLAQMDRGAPINERNPAIGYGVSALAVKQLLKTGGPENLLGLVREVGSGTGFEKALDVRYGTTLPRLQDELRDELSHL